jgi:hypothetical protein
VLSIPSVDARMFVTEKLGRGSTAGTLARQRRSSMPPFQSNGVNGDPAGSPYGPGYPGFPGFPA